MDPKLEKQLIEKYPKIFRQVNLPMTQTCMCWGIECGDGWYDLLDSLCYCIQEHCNQTEKIIQLEATQIKEKFGGLRFYVYGGDDYTDGLVRLAELMSYNICEYCGNRGKSYDDGWVRTMCEKCRQELLENKGKFLAK
jgi:hypothetical protein